MHINELFLSVRFWVLSVCFVLGVSGAFTWRIWDSYRTSVILPKKEVKTAQKALEAPELPPNYVQEVLPVPPEPRPTRKELRKKLNGKEIELASLTDVELPVFKKGKLSAILFADEIHYRRGKPIYLVKPILFEFAEDGTTVVRKTKANEGEAVLDEVDNEKTLQNLRLFGGGTKVEMRGKKDKSQKGTKSLF